ncbi:hypothetical protein EXN66_Car010648 [Channa argus]|uniref:Uncharacterized protein n=1 Tax=Channa argus TaxID=215402 RepID=A0A6G1PXI1_CHAAH|nr:hypothetical protein EXN66_Car010648 [Channa argus]
MTHSETDSTWDNKKDGVAKIRLLHQTERAVVKERSAALRTFTQHWEEKMKMAVMVIILSVFLLFT